MSESQTEKEIKEMLKSLKKVSINPQQTINRELHLSYVEYVLHDLG